VNSDDAHIPDEEPIEPILLPTSPFASPGESPELEAPPGEPSPPSRRPRVWTVWLVLVTALLASLAAATVVLYAAAIWQSGWGILLSGRRMSGALLEVSESPAGILSTVFATMVVFSGAAVTAAFVSPVPWRERLRLRAARISPFGLLLHVAGVLTIGVVFGALLSLGVLPESPALAGLGEFVAGLSGATLAAAVVVIGIAPGIAEELLFRGYIQTRFCQRWGVGWGILWTSVLFGVMHLDLIHGLFAFGLGIYLGYLTEWTGSIVPAMVCHAVNNTISTLRTAWGLDVEGREANLVALVVGLAFLAFCVWHLRAVVKRT
jgi:membrane protease YdiL (CAAX protease family)